MVQGEEWTWYQILMLIGVIIASGAFAIIVSEYPFGKKKNEEKKHKTKKKTK